MSDRLQCPCCGRIRDDWSADETKQLETAGAKAAQRSDAALDATAAYREWHRHLGSGFYVADIDQVEYRFGGDEPVPVAVIELTRVDGNQPVPDSYLRAITARFERDAQGRVARMVARMLGTNAFVVAFRHDLTEFWVFCLSEPEHGWRHMTQTRYVRWLADKRRDDVK